MSTAGAVRHTSGTRARVVELYEAGWRPAEIQKRLRSEGKPVPSRNTIWVWTHPDRAARNVERQNRSQRLGRVQNASFAWPGVRGPEWRLARMRVLAAAGLSQAAIAKVMNVDFPGAPITEHQVRGALETGRPPRPWRITDTEDSHEA